MHLNTLTVFVASQKRLKVLPAVEGTDGQTFLGSNASFVSSAKNEFVIHTEFE